MDYGLWGHKESDMTDHYIAISLHDIPASRVFHCRRLVRSIRSFIIKYSGFWQEDKTEIKKKKIQAEHYLHPLLEKKKKIPTLRLFLMGSHFFF